MIVSGVAHPALAPVAPDELGAGQRRISSVVRGLELGAERGETGKQCKSSSGSLSRRTVNCFLEAPCKDQRAHFSRSFLPTGVVTRPGAWEVRPDNSSLTCGLRDLLQ